MKLFISYRRKSWAFSERLADELRKSIDAEIFIDYRNIDETDFEVSILRHLRESDAVLLIVSEYTFAQDRIHKDDDWVRREISEAITLKKPIVVALIDAQQIPDIPADIQDIKKMQGINFYPEYFDAAVKRLVEFIVKATPLEPTNKSKNSDSAQSSLKITKATLREAIDLLEADDYDKAIFLLQELRENGYQSRVISIDELLADTEKHRIEQLRRREALSAYDDIVALSKSRITLSRAQLAWTAFQKEYPDFIDDPERLREKLRPSIADYSINQVSSRSTNGQKN